MEATVRLYELDFKNKKAYYAASIFVLGNIMLPQLCHLVPHGGAMLLPIYFFTLVGAYKYGWKVGALVAIFSPLVNSLLFGMPATSALPVIVVKSLLLAASAGFAAQRFKTISLPVIIGIVASYQIAGTLIEWWVVGDFYLALQDFRMGVPGMLLQIFGGFAFLKHILKQ